MDVVYTYIHIHYHSNECGREKKIWATKRADQKKN
jgi:hypothetical protein